MKIVIVNNFAHLTGGADQHCFGLTSALRSRGHEVAFLATEDERNVEHQGAFVACSVTHQARESLGVAGQARVASKALWNREAAGAMAGLIDEFRPDVVHAHKLYPQLSVAPIAVAARRKVPVVQTLHDFEMISASAIDVRGGRWDADESRLRFRFLNSLTLLPRRRVHATRVSSYVAVSRFVARVHAARGIASTVVPNFVDVPNGALARRPGFDERDGILYWGRLRQEKGVPDVVEMARRLPGVTVTLAGGGTLESWVREEAATIPNLRVLGFVPDDVLTELIRSARVVVIPSRCQDAGPLVPLEAMAHGTPVVAYAVGGLGEYVMDTGGGRVVPVDVEALAATASELHDDESTWERLSQSGHAAIAERHTAEHYAERLETIYEETANGRI